MIVWNDVEKGEVPKVGEAIFCYPSLCFGRVGENGIVTLDENMGHWDELLYGFNQPDNHRYNKPLDIIRYWTEVNEP